MMIDSAYKLTEFSKGSGCGCKIAPAVLQKILHTTSGVVHHPDLLVGNDTNDDAAVYRLPDKNGLISTVDFFTPIVDDPFDFGRIAAANAISDVYAMGGKPILAIAILGFPVEKLPPELAGRILDGARAVCSKAGIPLAGGHSIDTPEPVFGLSVNGLVREQELKRNNTARPGDLLFLTKPLGVGILAAAAKRGLADASQVRNVTEVMARLNDCGAELAGISGVHAMTDVTGFGLLGHLIEVCEGSGVSAEIDLAKLPMIEGASEFRDRFVFPDNTYRNWNAYEKKVTGVNGPEFITLCDPQTSGGLLVAADPSVHHEIKTVLEQFGLHDHVQPVGRCTAKGEFAVSVVSSR
ncbi:MAG: hypothetical protein RL021_2261 [Bacteroidota bacterium]|jgi:selenide,water dikinase